MPRPARPSWMRRLGARLARALRRPVPPCLPVSLACLALAVPALPAAAQPVAINEIFYDPPDRTQPLEFVELHNPGASAVDLSGWQFDAGITYTFPAGATLPAGGYVVVAQAPAVFEAAHGFAPFGPFSGKLSNGGEKIRLRDATGATIDEVTYGIGFPWPTAARGAGSSLELIHPSLDHNQPGSWRASGLPEAVPPPAVFVPTTDPAWRLRKGTSEASSPAGAWRALGFVEDGTWQTVQTSAGYGDGDDNTELSDMRGGYSCVFLRRVFTVPAGGIPEALVLRARVDDGCIVWINGTEVARLHVAGGDRAYNSFAEDHEASISSFEEVVIADAASLLVEGDNVIAVQGFNATLNSSDFTLDVALSGAAPVVDGLEPTPGAANSVRSTIAPPSIASVEHSPQQPASGEAVTITAQVSDPQGVAGVSLLYQRVAPGSYIRRTDAAYATSWTTVAMRDDGLGGDATAGDGLYTAVLAGPLQEHRHLTRYRVTTTDSGGAAVTVPYSDDEQPNFAYFTYDGAPGWSGALNPGTTPELTFPASTVARMPAFHLIADASDITNCQYNSGYNNQRFHGTLVHDGRVHDHIQFTNRGEFSTYVSGKNKWRFHFNRARDLATRDEWGRPYAETWDELNLNACASPWAAVNRGMAGIEEAVAFRMFELAGLPASKTHHLQLRVIDAAAETTTSQYDSDLWGLYLAIEQPDGSFLDERGLADGSIYKIESSAGDKKHQGETHPADTSDWDSFLAACRAGQTEAWWRENLDLDGYFTFRAVNRIVGAVDVREGWNHYFFHQADGRWTPIPWDLDMGFIAKSHQSGTIDQKACLAHPALATGYRNRARELLDLMCADGTPAGGQVGQLVDEFARMVAPDGATDTSWALLDACLWNYHPRTPATSYADTNHRGSFYKTPYTDSRFGGTWVRTLTTPDLAGQERRLIDYATDTFPAGQAWSVNNGIQYGYGYRFLLAESLDNAVPARPAATYAGPEGFPVDELTFSASAFSDPQGGATYAGTQWRIGEISAPGIPHFDPTQPRIYEITDVWRSEVLPTNDPAQPPSGLLTVGHTYRLRVRHLDATGRWSRWSEAVQFVAGASVVPPPTSATLVVSEMMYGPPALSTEDTAAGFNDRQAFEYVELLNISDASLDLGTTAFTTGITFSFPAGTLLAPGARILVVKNTAAFEHRYGPGLTIAGEYSGSLDNAGEQIVLQAGGVTVHDFAYSDDPPWPVEADGNGYSLVLVNPQLAPDHSLHTSWRASTTAAGHPGSADPIVFSEWAARHPGLAGGEGADSDGDGLSDVVEYALGTDPRATTTAARAPVGEIHLRESGGEMLPHLAFVFRRATEPGDVTRVVEFSSDLATWTADGERTQLIEHDDGTVTEIWTAAAPLDAGNPRQFARLRVTVP